MIYFISGAVRVEHDVDEIHTVPEFNPLSSGIFLYSRALSSFILMQHLHKTREKRCTASLIAPNNSGRVFNPVERDFHLI